MKRILFALMVLAQISAQAQQTEADDTSRVFDLIQQRIEGGARQRIDLDSTPHSDEIDSGYSTEFSYLARGSILFYQHFISSQDRPSCVFTPSCSHFGAACFQHYSPVKAALLTSDRLQRCHGWAYKSYPVDPATYRLLDPAESYESVE